MLRYNITGAWVTGGMPVCIYTQWQRWGFLVWTKCRTL